MPGHEELSRRMNSLSAAEAGGKRSKQGSISVVASIDKGRRLYMDLDLKRQAIRKLVTMICLPENEVKDDY